MVMRLDQTFSLGRASASISFSAARRRRRKRHLATTVYSSVLRLRTVLSLPVCRQPPALRARNDSCQRSMSIMRNLRVHFLSGSGPTWPLASRASSPICRNRTRRVWRAIWLSYASATLANNRVGDDDDDDDDDKKTGLSMSGNVLGSAP
ncbi:hypothetical protein ColKHC_14122 [Colletotrichum higginsianum]|nr:hypothetical protein ColKHC_14122 [Colletotrichum higginsianum]